MEKRPFFRAVRPDWGNTARAATAGLGSKGIITVLLLIPFNIMVFLPIKILTDSSAITSHGTIYVISGS